MAKSILDCRSYYALPGRWIALIPFVIGSAASVSFRAITSTSTEGILFILPPSLLRIVDSVVDYCLALPLLLLLLLGCVLHLLLLANAMQPDDLFWQSEMELNASVHSPFHSAENDVECLNAHDAFVFFIGCLSDCCCSLNMIRSPFMDRPTARLLVAARYSGNRVDGDGLNGRTADGWRGEKQKNKYT